MKPGTTGTMPAPQQRQQHAPRAPARLGHVGRGLAVAAVGHHDLERRRTLLRAPTGAGQRRRHHRARGALAARDQGVAGARREVGRARPWRARSRGTRAPARRPAPAAGARGAVRARARARGRGGAAGTGRRRSTAASGSPATERRAPSSSRSVTPASAETTTTSGPRCAWISETALRTAAASASDAPPNFQTSSRCRPAGAHALSSHVRVLIGGMRRTGARGRTPAKRADSTAAQRASWYVCRASQRTAHGHAVLLRGREAPAAHGRERGARRAPRRPTRRRRARSARRSRRRRRLIVTVPLRRAPPARLREHRRAPRACAAA